MSDINIQKVFDNSEDRKQLPMNRKTSFNNAELNNLRSSANARMGELVHDTTFIGFGGGKVNTDGTYEVIAQTGSDLADDKLKDILQEKFSTDEKLNDLLGQIKAYNAKYGATTGNSAESTSENANKDSFTQSEGTDENKRWIDQIRLGNSGSQAQYQLLYPTTTPYTTDVGIQRVEKWIKEGGDYPDIHQYAGNYNFKA